MLDVSVIIVNFNSSDMLCNCIKSLRSFPSLVAREIIVVDNNSTYDEVMKLQTIDGIDKVILNNDNVGFGTANNIGALHAGGRYLLLLNPDTLILNDICGVFVNTYERLSTLRIGVLGCRQRNKDMSDNHSSGSFNGHKPLAFLQNELYQNCIKQVTTYVKRIIKMNRSGDSQRKTMNPERINELEMVDWINGACLFMESGVYRQVGGFDERFFLFSEEVDLQKRLFDKGFRQYIVNGLELIHLHEKNRKMSNSNRINFYRGYLYYINKHFGMVPYLVVRISLLGILSIGSIIDILTKRYLVKENVKCLIKIAL